LLQIDALHPGQPAPLHPLVDFQRGPGGQAEMLLGYMVRDLPSSVYGEHPQEWEGEAGLIHRVIRALAKQDGVGVVGRVIALELPAEPKLALVASVLDGMPTACFYRESLGWLNQQLEPLYASHTAAVLIIVDVMLCRVVRQRAPFDPEADEQERKRQRQAEEDLHTLLEGAFSGWLTPVIHALCTAPPPVPEHTSREFRLAATRAYGHQFSAAANLYGNMLDEQVPGATQKSHLMMLLDFAILGVGRTGAVMSLFRTAARNQSRRDCAELLKALLTRLPAMECPTFPAQPNARPVHELTMLNEAIGALLMNLTRNDLSNTIYDSLRNLVENDRGNSGFLKWDVRRARVPGAEGVWSSAIYLVTSIATMVLSDRFQRAVADKLLLLLKHHSDTQRLPPDVMRDVFRGLHKLLRHGGISIGLHVGAALIAFATAWQGVDLADTAQVDAIYPYAHECLRCLRSLLYCHADYPMANIMSPDGKQQDLVEGVCAKLELIQNRGEDEDDDDASGGASGESMEEPNGESDAMDVDHNS
jgi:hypothetical protein